MTVKMETSGDVVLHGINKECSLKWQESWRWCHCQILLLGILMIWFLQRVVQVKFTCSMRNKQNITKYHKCGVLPPSRNVWHEISHPETILEISIFTWQKFH